jgi:hypothetical protein
MSKTSATSAVEWSRLTLADFIEGCKNLSFLGKAIQLFLREDQFAVNDDLENSPARGYEFGFDTSFIFDAGRQTSGSWFVVSNLAVFDGDVHV